MASGFTRRPVVDRSELAGTWSYVLTFNAERELPPGRAAALAALEDVPPLSRALDEQLGLKLEPTRTVLDLIVIDGVQPPPPD